MEAALYAQGRNKKRKSVYKVHIWQAGVPSNQGGCMPQRKEMPLRSEDKSDKAKKKEQEGDSSKQ